MTKMTSSLKVRLIILATVLLYSLTSIAGARTSAKGNEVCIGSTCFDATLTVNETALPVRGMDTLTWWGFRLYTAAFYVPRESEGIDGVLGDVPRTLVLHYHRQIKRQDIIRSSENFFQKNPRNDVKALRERMDTVYSYYQTVQEGDRYEITYAPGIGTTVSFNGKAHPVIAGEDFARAFFGIWLSEVPINKNSRDRLIGASKK